MCVEGFLLPQNVRYKPTDLFADGQVLKGLTLIPDDTHRMDVYC